MGLLKVKTRYYLFFCAFLLLWIILFWKCRYGLPLDETFYILFCYRFMNGDMPVLHEWNPTQFFALWIHPFVWLFYKIQGNSEQVILIFRYLFTVIWGLSALFLFFRLKKVSFVGAALASLIFLAFVPYGQLALYYNTIGLIALSSALAIVITAEKYKKIQYSVAGFLLAVAVTCCPFLLLLYFAFFVVAVVFALKKNKEYLLMFFYITVGTIPAIIYFYIYYVVPSSLQDFINGIPHLLSDRQHQFTYSEKFIGFFKSVFLSSPMIILIILMIIAFLIADRKKKKVKVAGFVAVCISSLILDVDFYLKMNPNSNCYIFTPIFIGLYCGLMSKNEKAKKLFYFMWLPGLIYMFCINISSEVGFDAVVIPAIICTMASCFLCSIFISEISSDNEGGSRRICTISSSVLAATTIGILLFGMTFYAFANGETITQKTKIEQGPCKGLYCTQEIKDRYSAVVSELETFRDGEHENVLLLCHYWSYLDIDKKPVLCSCFYPFVDDVLLDQLEEYYDLYPQFTPDAIYIGSKYTDLLARIESYGYSGEQTPSGGYILYRD